MNTICLNGEFLQLGTERLSITDAGFMLGDGVFETIRVEQGQLLHHAEHFARLARGARVLEIPYQLNTEELLAWCQQIADINELGNARLRITLTRGPLKNLPIVETEGEPTIAIVASELDEDRIIRQRSQGIGAVIVTIPRNHRSPLASIKSTSYLDSLLARREARRLGFEEGIMLNTEGRVAECTMSNIFVVRDGVLRTPPLSDGALPGIMRNVVLRLAYNLDIVAREREVTVERIIESDEVFLTNSLIQILPVVQVGERAIADARVGPVAKLIYETWRREAEEFLRENRG